MSESAPASPSVHIAIDADALRDLRQDRGLTQSALADLAGITPQYLWQLENEKRTHMRPPTFVRLCDALNLPEQRRAELRKQRAKVA